MESISLGVTGFARSKSIRAEGNSFSTMPWETVTEIVLDNWQDAVPGDGEEDTSRKILVPVPAQGFFCPIRSRIVDGLSVQAEIVRRQEHEEPFVDTFVRFEDAATALSLIEEPAKTVNVVCFSREALSEDGENPDTDCDWEIVTILASSDEGQAPMPSLTMARNFLRKPGGTFTDYTAEAFAESIWHHETKGTLRVKSG